MKGKETKKANNTRRELILTDESYRHQCNESNNKLYRTQKMKDIIMMSKKKQKAKQRKGDICWKTVR